VSRIGVLAWGSLKWDRRQLSTRGTWHEDGPTLPLEFSRKSLDGRLTLVIDRTDGEACRSGWWESGLADVAGAIANLGDREGTRVIASIDLDGNSDLNSQDRVVDSVRIWLRETAMDAVIWTDLKPNFRETLGSEFSVEEAMSYLKRLNGNTRLKAWEYLEKAPAAVQTPLRRRLVEEGWIVVRSE
jgi:hypothetical protein